MQVNNNNNAIAKDETKQNNNLCKAHNRLLLGLPSGLWTLIWIKPATEGFEWLSKKIGLDTPSSLLQPFQCETVKELVNVTINDDCTGTTYSFNDPSANGTTYTFNNTYTKGLCGIKHIPNDLHTIFSRTLTCSGLSLCAQLGVQELLSWATHKACKYFDADPVVAQRIEAVSKLSRILISAAAGVGFYALNYGVGEGNGLRTTADLIGEFALRSLISGTHEQGNFMLTLGVGALVSWAEIPHIKATLKV